MTKNEEACLAQAIQSANGLVDEIVVLDTGSSDQTIPIAKSMGATVYQTNWENDFAKARNFGLSKIKTDWVLILDADEVLDEVGKSYLKNWLKNPTANLASLCQVNYSDKKELLLWQPVKKNQGLDTTKAGYILLRPIRLFLTNHGFHYKGVLHEEVVGYEDEAVAALPVYLHHYNEEQRQNHPEKLSHYLKLAIKKVELHPKDPKAWFELASVYVELSHKKEAIGALERACLLAPNNRLCLLSLAHLYFQTGSLALALTKVDQILNLYPKDERSLILYVKIMFERGLVDQARQMTSFLAELGMDYPEVIGFEGLLALVDKKYANAIHSFETLTKKFPNDILNQFYLMAAYDLGGDLIRKNQIFEKFKEKLSSEEMNFYLDFVNRKLGKLNVSFHSFGQMNCV